MQHLEELALQIYADKSAIVCEACKLDDMTEFARDILNSFHLQDLQMVIRDDDYFCGMRANHFCLECGQSEELPDDNARYVFIVSANHKGTRMYTILI